MQRHRRHRPSWAPQAVRSTELSFALNELDAQAADLLLFGADPDFTAGAARYGTLTAQAAIFIRA